MGRAYISGVIASRLRFRERRSQTGSDVFCHASELLPVASERIVALTFCPFDFICTWSASKHQSLLLLGLQVSS
jgi:hypothetical protein